MSDLVINFEGSWFGHGDDPFADIEDVDLEDLVVNQDGDSDDDDDLLTIPEIDFVALANERGCNCHGKRSDAQTQNVTRDDDDEDLLMPGPEIDWVALARNRERN